MAQDDLDSQEEFSLKISDAVDDLFNPVRKIEIDPATNEVRDLAGADSAVADSSAGDSGSVKEDGAAAGAGAPDRSSLGPLLQELDQSLMTLDWEVSRTNVGTMRDLLDKVVREYDLGALAASGGVVFLMHQLLSAMNDAPESVPTSGPLALKTGLSAIQQAAQHGQPYDQEIREQLEQAQNALVSVIPDGGDSPPASTGASDDIVNISLPDEFANALKIHLARLEQLIGQRLAPVEQFFGKAPSMAKLYVIIKGVKEQLVEQKKCLQDMLRGKLSHVIPVSNPVSITIDIANQCQDMMQFHIQVLEHCARRIAPIEKLFSEMAGQQKLYAIHFEIRSGLTDQRGYLVQVLTGDYSPPSPPAKAPVIVKPKNVPCPWPVLATGSWQGERVAFIPEQINFEGYCSWWSGGGLAKLHAFPLKKLKAWPWSGLKAYFRGELAVRSNKELASMEFPILDLDLPGSGKSGKAVVVLFQGARGGVVLMDAELDNLNVGEQFLWKPATINESIFVGELTTEFGEPIPVVDITRL